MKMSTRGEMFPYITKDYGHNECSFLDRFESGCKSNNLDMVKSAMEEYQNCSSAKPLDEMVFAGGDFEQIPLIGCVVKTSNKEILALVLEKKAFKIIENSMTPIHWLTHRIFPKTEDFKEMLKMLCDVGYDVNAKCICGETPLSYACLNINTLDIFHVEIVKALIEEGADVNPEVKYDTPLEVCALQNRPRIFQLLLTNGADVNKFRSADYLVRSVSRNKDYFKVLKYLILYGFDVNRLPTADLHLLLSSNSQLEYKQVAELYELLCQLRFKFTESLLEVTKWIGRSHDVLTLQRLSANRIRDRLRSNLYLKLESMDREYLPPNMKDYILLKNV